MARRPHPPVISYNTHRRTRPRGGGTERRNPFFQPDTSRTRPTTPIWKGGNDVRLMPRWPSRTVRHRPAPPRALRPGNSEKRTRCVGGRLLAVLLGTLLFAAVSSEAQTAERAAPGARADGDVTGATPDASEKNPPATGDPSADADAGPLGLPWDGDAGSVRLEFERSAPPQPGLLERIDRTFARIVAGLERVLFYRVFKKERQYVQLNHIEHFVRPIDSDGPFRRLRRDGTYPKAELTDADIVALTVRGQLIPGADGRPIRRATLVRLPGQVGAEGGKPRRIPVEVVSVVIDNTTKYVLAEDGFFYRELPKRGLLDRNDRKTPEQIERLFAAGRLAVEPNGAYLKTEVIAGAPLVVLWLACGAVFFTIYMRGFNIWGFRHAVEIVRGKYDNPEEHGEVTHFQALASALSATVGLGNIAGVTIAMTMGGPGAFFWMMVCGVLGMSSKFAECTLGQKYRLVKPDGTVLGGPMRYLRVGLQEIGLGGLGAVLAFAFTIMCVFASFGGGNMFQANQSGSAILAALQESDNEQLRALAEQIENAATRGDVERVRELEAEQHRLRQGMAEYEKRFRAVYGVILAVLVGLVIIGGIKRIGRVAEKIVPAMCLMYVAACLWIILNHAAHIPSLAAQVITEAFSGQAVAGGVLGVLVIGVQRAAFSNEAGVGSAAIAHSAARTEEPIREGAVALLEPFIDTVVVCSMTALVILITGAWDNDQWIVNEGLEGAALTSRAFGNEISWFPKLLCVAVGLFAYSTIISWSYYGERSWETLFGPRSIMIYKVLAVIAVFVGSVVNLGAVLSFSDMMILSMAFPNILGVALLSPKIRRDLMDYWRRYKAGEFDRPKRPAQERPAEQPAQ
ncbi:MAG: alanine:cation symporter family protein [Planctomycetota bacterium]|nr:MAG: alanine:cation symporter family protein [Planctomycetota bacterium]